MIVYDQTTRTFFLHGKSFSCALWVHPAGYLVGLHFGGPIGGDDLRYFDPSARELSFSPIPPDVDSYFSLDVAGSEYGSFGQGDFRTPSVLLVRENGERASRFHYVSHTICDGAPDLGVLPSARGGKTLSITLKDVLSEAEIVLNYTLYEDSDVLVRNAEIVNRGSSPMRLLRAESFCLDLAAGEYDVLRLHGRHNMERMPERTPLGHGSVKIGSARGASSHQMNPFLVLLERGAGEDAGVCVGFELLYSGSWMLEAEETQTGAVRVSGGLNDLGFSWLLGAGEKFITPQVAICYSAHGLGEMSRSYADFLRGHVLPENRVYAPRPVLVNNWEATYFDFDREKLCALADEAAPLGIDTLVLDDGWFGGRNDDLTSLGDWFVNEKKLVGGLGPVIEHCKKRGMKFGIWFEPEMISEDSALYRAHPDWAIGRADVPRCKSRHQYVLDMTREEVTDYLFARMSDILSRHEISYVKWDMNRHITEFYSASLPAERQGEFAHRYILGVYRLIRRLQAAFPNVFFEGCSGGGGRFDGGMLCFFPQFWTSDDTDAYERAKIQWGTSYGYPLSAMSCHVSACPNHQTGRTVPFSARGAIASLGATGYELDLGRLSAEEKAQVKEQIANYHEIEQLILRGDLYRIADPYQGNLFCVAVVSKDKTRAYVVGMRIHALPGDFDRRIRLKGLRCEQTYTVEELGLTLRGDTLMNAGLLLPRLPDFGSWVWHLSAKKNS